MTEEKESGNEYLFEIASFLITTAKKCLDDESHYCPLRLIQALHKLSFLPEYVQELEEDEFLIKIRKKVDELYSLPSFWRKPTLQQFTKKLSHDLIEEIKKRKHMT